GGSGSSIWGTNFYTDDSSVCVAAVHMGAIGFAAGGSVTFEIYRGMTSYAATTANGVTSSSYGTWSGSFAIVP
ncbi:MAG TPA: LCCL domain-containing protein, partial [Archangium sp.]